MSATIEDLRLMIDGKLAAMDKEPQNVQVVMQLSMFCPPLVREMDGDHMRICHVNPAPGGGEFVVNWGFDVHMLSFIKCEARQT